MSELDRIWREGDPLWVWPEGETAPRRMWMQMPQSFVVDRLNDLERQLSDVGSINLSLMEKLAELEQQLADMTEDVKWKPMDDAPHGVWIIVSTIFETAAQACWNSNGRWTMYDNSRLTNNQVNGWMNLPTALKEQDNG